MVRTLGMAASALLIGSCFLLWVSLPDRNIEITGISAAGTKFGKPGYFNLLTTVLYSLLLLPKQPWVRRANVFVAALNLSWVVRNYLSLTACFAGDCPVVHTGFYLYALAAIAMMAIILFAPQKDVLPKTDPDTD